MRLPHQQLQRRNPRHDRPWIAPDLRTDRRRSGVGVGQATGKTGYFVIIDTISHVDSEIVLLTLDGETLETTADIPFYMWSEQTNGVRISLLASGSMRVSCNLAMTFCKPMERLGEVRSVQVVAQSQPMYNLTVDQAHTFFVGRGQWLVHNAGPCGQAFNIAKSDGESIQGIIRTILEDLLMKSQKVSNRLSL